ncbi:MAG: DUF4403 family protein [Luteibaculaceae bacterium]
MRILKIARFLTILSFLLAVSCAKESADSSFEYEFSGNFLPELQADKSHINIPILFPFSALERIINKSLPDTLVKDDSFDNNDKDNIKVVVLRKGPVSLSTNNGLIKFTVPLHVNAEYQITKPFKLVQPLTCEAKIELLTSVDIGKNWELLTHAMISKINWIVEPEINLGILKLNITKQIESVIYSQQENWMRKIDKVVATEVNLEREVVKIYQEIQKPILLKSSEPKVWLYNLTENLWTGKVQVKNNGIKVAANIDLIPKIESGELKEFVPKILGKNNKIGLAKDGFQLNPIINLSFKHLTQVLKDEIVGKPLKIANTEIKIESAELLGDSSFVYCKILVESPVKGKLLLKGEPMFNNLTKSLEIANLDYIIIQAPGYVNIASWYAKDDALKLLSEKAVFPLGDILENVPALITEALNGSNISENISLNFNANSIIIHKILPQENVLQILGVMEGSTGITIKKL